MPEQKVGLVTGAAAGIGAGIAERFAEAGYAIAVLDIDGAGAREMASKLPQAVAIEGDVSSEDDAIRAVATTVDELGRLDVLINNAGIELTGTVEQLSSADWDRQMAVNLRGLFLMSKYAVPKMRLGGGGAIVNISSVHALVSWPGGMAYDATKAGIIVATGGIAPTSEGAKIVLKDGEFTVVDGPFAEAKELVGGWALMECRDRGEAIEWSKRFLSVLGEGEVRVRPCM